MSEEKPLHVRVAEAIGWTGAHRSGWAYLNDADKVTEDRREWTGWSPWQDESTKTPFGYQPIPRYDTSWAATGPLIERYRIHLSVERDDYPDKPVIWAADNWREHEIVDYGEGPLVAVCHLLLALAEAGKLREPA